MSGTKGSSCGQNVQCQDPCKNPCSDPCQASASVDPCKAGNQGSHHHHHHHHGHHHKQDAGNPCCPDSSQNKGTYYCSK